ncbi:hypothetical protein L2E82_15696 [Cichorium intybus]|uniref:Uncharacterized protein n=1 Tax=Cichorium intybus TaxID=13427 RepID=A0ACB9F3Y1_CICIN|nr:hypothetical protein L2E82_15696 [Cichorium intybus]
MRVSLAGNVCTKQPIAQIAGILIEESPESESLISLEIWSITAFAAGELVLKASRLRSGFDSDAVVISMTFIKPLVCNSPFSVSIILAKQKALTMAEIQPLLL